MTELLIARMLWDHKALWIFFSMKCVFFPPPLPPPLSCHLLIRLKGWEEQLSQNELSFSPKPFLLRLGKYCQENDPAEPQWATTGDAVRFYLNASVPKCSSFFPPLLWTGIISVAVKSECRLESQAHRYLIVHIHLPASQQHKMGSLFPF